MVCGWGDVSFQPSELAKFALAVYLAYSMSKKGTVMDSFTKGVMPHLLVTGLFMLLIVLEPDLGTTVIIGCWLLTLLFVAGARVYQLTALLVAAGAGCQVAHLVAGRVLEGSGDLVPGPVERPARHGLPDHSFVPGLRLRGGCSAPGSEAASRRCSGFPSPTRISCCPSRARNWGSRGVIVIITLFTVLTLRGIKLSLEARDDYQSYLALGLSTLLGLQVVVNMAVVMGLLPPRDSPCRS